MEGTDFSLSSLLIVVVLSFLIPIVLSKFKKVTIPVIVGEIIVGMLIGKSGLDIIQMDQSLEFLEFFGLSYLMFMAGLEIDFDIFNKKQGKNSGKTTLNFIKNPIILSLIILTITIGLAYVASIYMELHGLISYPFFMALIIGTTSLGIVLPILKEKNIIDTTYGQYLIMGGVMADFVTMILISVALSLYTGGLSPKIFLIFLLLILVFAIYRFSKKIQVTTFSKELSNGSTQIGIRGSLALMVFFIFLAQAISVEVILGAFLAGVVVSLISPKNSREEITAKIDAVGFGFLIPIFFILVGVEFDFSVFVNNPKALLLVPILLALIYFVKAVPALLLRLKFPWKESVAGGILLSSQLSLTIAAAEIGVEIGALTEEAGAAILLVAIFTSIISPIFFNKLIPTKNDEEDNRHVVILGATEEAFILAKRLMKNNIRVLFVICNQQKKESLEEYGFEIIYGDFMDVDILDKADLNNTKSVIINTGEDQLNYQLSNFVTTQYDIQDVIVLITDPILFRKAQNNEMIRLVNPRISTSNLLENMVRHPLTTNILEDKRNLIVEEVDVYNRELVGKSLRNLKLPGDILIFSIYRKEETIVPHGDTKIKRKDTLLILGTADNVAEFRHFAMRRR